MEISETIANRAESADSGHESFLDVFMAMRLDREYMKQNLEYIAQWEAQFHDEIVREMQDYPEGKNGFEFEVRMGRKTWSFKGIPEWEDANDFKKQVESKYKAIWEAKQKGAVHADVSEDGEELPLPEIGYTKSSLILKRKKGESP